LHIYGSEPLPNYIKRNLKNYTKLASLEATLV